MVDYHLDQQLQHLSELLETSGCDAKAQMQIKTLVTEMLAQADPVMFYQSVFHGDLPEYEAHKTARLLQIAKDFTGRILYLQVQETMLHETVQELLLSVLESKEGQNTCVPLEKGAFAIVYEIKGEDDAKEFAFAIIQSIQEELACEAMVGMGDVFSDLKSLKISYDHAKTALQAGGKLLGHSVFYEYEKLGIAKAVWDMTPEQSRLFLKETLTPEADRELQNKEMLESIDIFFKYNLNISVAARELYVHRNTLVYRIEKFNKASGYNLSEFHDAALIQFILMVRRKLADD